MTCWTRRERWTASGSILRTVAAARRGIQLLPLDAVLRAGLLAVADAGGVERPAHDLVAHARQVLDAAAAHEHDGVLLQVVALARDVGRDLDASRDADTRDLAQRGVRLLRGRGVHARAHATALRGGHLLLAALAGLQARGGQLLGLRCTSLADELARGRHAARDGSEVRTAPAGGGESPPRVTSRLRHAQLSTHRCGGRSNRRRTMGGHHLWAA